MEARNESFFRHPRITAAPGVRKPMFHLHLQGLIMHFRRSLPAPRETSGSPGWISATSPTGTSTTGVRQMAAPLWSREKVLSTYVAGYSYIFTDGFRFPFGDYFDMDIDNQSHTQT